MIKDSGARRSFPSGAVRDIAEGKGRADLLPLGIIAYHTDDDILANVEKYIRTGNTNRLWQAITLFCEEVYGNLPTGLLEVSIQYEQGAAKYSDRNWEKGIPVHCFIDSGVRHYLKFRRGDKDEPHDKAFTWNLLGCLWTHVNKPELIDLPFAEDKPQRV